jgi:hypothetical protein
MSQDERQSWASGALSDGAHDYSGRISIPHDLREEGRGYVFEEVDERPNGSCVAIGRICFFDFYP